MAQEKINTMKSLEAQNVLKSDTWGYALSTFSKGNSDMEGGDKYYKVPSSIPLDDYVKQFPSAKYVSMESINTTGKTIRILYFHDMKHRIIHSTQSIEVIDEVVYVGKLQPRPMSSFSWLMYKLFHARPKTRTDIRVRM